MIKGHTITLVIPCHNEQDGLAMMLPKVPPCVDEVLVVDNNSTDGTAEVARGLGARVVAASKPGYGAAYKVGLAAATGDIVVTADGDDTYPVVETERLVGNLLDAGLEFVSASRFPLSDRRNMSWVSRLGNWGLTVAARILFGTKLLDSQSGMWIFKRDVLQRMRLESDGMAFSEEIKLEAMRNGIRFAELHIPYHARVGSTKLNPLRDGFLNLWFLVKIRLRRK